MAEPNELKAQLGGAISKRQPLTFLDPRGKEITGVFIPEKIENGPEKIADARNFDREAVVTQEDMDKMRDLAKKMYEAANAYCEGKKNLNLDTASPYQKTRLEIGQMARDFAKKAMGKVTEKEQKTLDENEKLAQENEARTRGNKKEAEDLKNNGPALQ